jgi:hypothetical protein
MQQSRDEIRCSSDPRVPLPLRSLAKLATAMRVPWETPLCDAIGTTQVRLPCQREMRPTAIEGIYQTMQSL